MKISSKRGIWMYCIPIGIPILVWISWLSAKQSLQNNSMDILSVVVIVLAIFFILGMCTVFWFEYQVTEKGLSVVYKVPSLIERRIRFVPWNSIQRIDFLPVSMGYLMISGLRDKPRTGIPLAVGWYSNRIELMKACIEAAHQVNPNLVIGDSLLRDFGKPPYGIFQAKE